MTGLSNPPSKITRRLKVQARQGWKSPRWLGVNKSVVCDTFSLPCSDTVGWVIGRASSLKKLDVRMLVMICLELCR